MPQRITAHHAVADPDFLNRPGDELLDDVWQFELAGKLTRDRLGSERHNRRLLRCIGSSGNPRLVGMCRELYDHREWLWTFLDVEGVEPTNNAAERSLRHAVIWRKLSFGTQSAGGSRFVETLLSIIETCRQQSRNVFEYVTQTVTARLQHRKCPSIIGGV